jgi:Transposase DDE domain
MSILKRARGFVQRLTNLAGELTEGEAKLTSDLVVGISQAQSVLLSETARVTNGIEGASNEDDPRALIRTEQRLSKGLAKTRSGLDELPQAWLKLAGPTVRRMKFVSVDGSDIAKPYGGTFEHLDRVRDGSAPGKPITPGYWLINIEAADGLGHHVPLVMTPFSTKDPSYQEGGDCAWSRTFQEEMRKVKPVTAGDATWLFDRGFDSNEHLDFMRDFGRKHVVRLKRNRNVVVGDEATPVVQNIATFAAGLKKPHSARIRYVDKETHEQKTGLVSFAYVPVRLPEVGGAYWLIVVTGTRGEDWLLLSSHRPRNAKEAGAIIGAYIERWGSEEITRLWKQCVDAEDVRVRKLCAIRRLLFLSMVAVGIQALWLLLRPGAAQKLIARMQVFIPTVRFQYYRLWRGAAHALNHGG